MQDPKACFDFPCPSTSRSVYTLLASLNHRFTNPLISIIHLQSQKLANMHSANAIFADLTYGITTVDNKSENLAKTWQLHLKSESMLFLTCNDAHIDSISFYAAISLYLSPVRGTEFVKSV